MAYVFLGSDVVTGQKVVLKTLRQELAFSPSIRERVYREALCLARVIHPNVPSICDVFEYGAAVVLVLEFVDGGTLEDQIRSIPQNGPLRPQDIRRWSLGLLSGLGAFHSRSFVHRDVKPSNILLTRSGIPKLTDLGITLDASGERARLTKQGSRPGTAQYMAPEQVLGMEIGPWTDIYAAGLVLYEMFVGAPPFEADSDFDMMDLHVKGTPDISRLPRLTPPPVVSAIERSLCKDPHHRIRSAEEIYAVVEAWSP